MHITNMAQRAALNDGGAAIKIMESTLGNSIENNQERVDFQK